MHVSASVRAWPARAVCNSFAYVNRLQLCHHMTFRLLHYFSATPRGVLTARHGGGGWFCLHKMRLFKQMRGKMLYEEHSSEAGILLTWGRFLWEILKRSTTYILTAPPLVSALAPPPSICNDPWDVIGRNVSAFAMLLKDTVIKMPSHL